MSKPFHGESKAIENIAARIDLTAPIGVVVSEWSLLEFLLANCFQTLVFGGDDTYDVSKTIVFETFESLVTLGVKKAFLLQAAERRLDEKMLKKLDGIMTTVEGLQKRRNKIIHGYWRLPKDNTIEGFVWSNSLFGDKELYTLGDLVGLRTDLHKLLVRLHEFVLEVEPFLKSRGLFASLIASYANVIETKKPENTS